MHIDVLLMLANDQQQRIRHEVARNRMASQAQISRTSTAMEIRQRLGAGIIWVGMQLQGAMPTQSDPTERVDPMPAGQMGH